MKQGHYQKSLGSKVATIAVNINFVDIKGPLSTFQSTKLEKDDFLKLLNTINHEQEKPLEENKLAKTFEAFWPQFQENIEKVLKDVVKPVKEKAAKKDDIRESLEELLQLCRSQNIMLGDCLRRGRTNPFADSPSRSTSDIMEAIYVYIDKLLRDTSIPSYVLDDVTELAYRASYRRPEWRERYMYLLDKYRVTIRNRLEVDQSSKE